MQTHGGGFRCGNAGLKDNADYLMDGNVVLVNIHYRLGTLGQLSKIDEFVINLANINHHCEFSDFEGFLSTEDSIIPGNFGLKDQSMGLHWVKENIKAFGGDDEKITVFGESAGGASAHYHLMSPLSKSM